MHESHLQLHGHHTEFNSLLKFLTFQLAALQIIQLVLANSIHTMHVLKIVSLFRKRRKHNIEIKSYFIDILLSRLHLSNFDLVKLCMKN